MTEPQKPTVVGECRIALVHHIDALFPQFAAQLEKSCARTGGEINAGFLWTEVRAGHAFALVAVDEAENVWGMVILRFETWASGPRIVALGMAGSEMRHWWQPMSDEIRRRGKEAGCVSWIDQGSKGLEKHLKNTPGFRVVSVKYEVTL